MVFSSYSNASYLPLDSDQGVTFYKNENLLFSPPPVTASPTALVCRRNSPVAAMLTAATGSGSPFGGQPLHHGTHQFHGNNVCDDFQPVAHLSSNGYYGYVPPAATAANPKVMSTEQAGTPPAAAAATHVNGAGVGVLLDSTHSVAAADDSHSMMMDCGGGNAAGGSGGLVHAENYQQQQQLRKRKEYNDEVEVNCKRRKTWLEQPNNNDADFVYAQTWNQSSSHEMECIDQPMDQFSSQQPFQQSPVIMNAPTTVAFNGFSHHPQQNLISAGPIPIAPQPHTVLQPKSKYIDTSRCMMSHMI